jgi:hypothetical protein
MKPSHSNQLTLDAYQINAEEYIKKTPPSITDYSPKMQQWIDAALNIINHTGVVFEIGSAIPRDTDYMKRMGVQVVTSDAVPHLVEHLRKINPDTLLFNVITDDFPSTYDLIFSNGVFPHFNADEARHVLTKIHDALNTTGAIALSLKIGHGDNWIVEKFNAKRYTHFWSLDDFTALLQERGFDVVFHNDNTGQHPSHRWVNIIAVKR